jgi:hypothetical protein
VLAEAFLAGFPDGRMRLVNFLHHGAEQTGEFGQLTSQQRLAKLHVAQESVDGVGQLPIGSGAEQAVRQ